MNKAELKKITCWTEGGEADCLIHPKPEQERRARAGNAVPSDFYQPDDSHNHRCSMDHPPCPACELLEEREYEREAGL